MRFLKHILAIAIMALFCAGAMASSYPSIQGIEDTTILRGSGAMEKFVDLRDYTHDDYYSASNLYYKIESQSNLGLIDCHIEDDYFVSCEAPKAGVLGMSTIKVSATNSHGNKDYDSFNINVKEPELEGIVFEADREEVYLENRDSMNVVFTVKNGTDEKKEFEVSTYLDNDERDEIKATPSSREFYLNAGEKTTFTVTISSSKDTRADDYDVEVKLDYGHGSKEITIDVEVMDNDDPVDIVRKSDYYVCREPYTQEIEIRLENNSSREQTILLGTDHELLMPEFEFSETTLEAGESDTMALRIHTNYTTKFTEYTIPVIARSGDYYVQRDITFRLVECEENFFDLIVTPKEQDIERGDSETFLVKLKSASNEGQEIRLSSDSDLPNALDETIVYLPANGVKYVDLEVSARESDEDGEHKVKVYAWNSNESEEETVSVDVESEHDIELLVENNGFEARPCSATSAQTFEITVKNTGDYDEEIEFEIENGEDTIQAILSDEEIEVEAGEEKKVYVLVSPSFGTELGKYTIILEAKTSEETIRKTLYFSVTEAEEGIQEGIILITNYPNELNLSEGEEKQVSFTIRNPTGTRMENLAIRFYGNGSKVYIFPLSIDSLGPNETLTVIRNARAAENAGGKIYDTTIEVSADGFVSTAEMRIRVAETIENAEEEDDETGLFAGFSVLSGGEIVLGGAIILILLIAILIGLSLLNSNKSEDVVLTLETTGAKKK